MSYSLIYDLLLIIPVIAFTFGVAPRGAKAFVLAVLYCAPIVYFFLGSSAINWIPLALGWLFIVMDRALAESCRAVLAVKAQQKMSST